MVTKPQTDKFWQQVNPVGRPPKFATAQELWDAACGYFTWAADSHLEAIDYFGKDATPCTLYKMRAFSFRALCLRIGVHQRYFIELKERLNAIEEPTDNDSDILRVIDAIEATIYQQQIEGATAGLLAGNIISRLLGLVDKTESKNENTNDNTHNFTGPLTVEVKSAGVPLAGSEKEVDAIR